MGIRYLAAIFTIWGKRKGKKGKKFSPFLELDSSLDYLGPKNYDEGRSEVLTLTTSSVDSG